VAEADTFEEAGVMPRDCAALVSKLQSDTCAVFSARITHLNGNRMNLTYKQGVVHELLSGILHFFCLSHCIRCPRRLLEGKAQSLADSEWIWLVLLGFPTMSNTGARSH